jgi:hypothetical protein
MGKKTDFAELRRGLGLVRGLGDEFMQACERVNPPVEALHRLVTPRGRDTMDEIVRLAVADWQAEQSKPVEHFDTSTDEVLAEMDRRGFRPARHEDFFGSPEKNEK